ncbi:histidine kinase [Priestia aryabhattai]|uniref:KdpD-like non-kinase potassium sensor n=1 Tax=Priestia TaxID=2800373 RepID=UPI000BA13344|nr:KdpD-like non-kinase potassium sensor [Priestia flexa]MDT2046351.1 KdpD-like non-kinase potassium sensor [Priestia flexa]OZT13916.1 histidine kinase [Priestia aryabhattai]USY53629.1 KdpD-like non-kinase potassium sensor [Bacillus sp. 1780r2a1]
MKDDKAHPYFRKKTPDELLKEFHYKQLGEFKLYIGAAPGVGKTYKMLQDAHDLQQEGLDVVIGYIETHGRTDTERMIGNLEIIPRQKIVYKKRTFHELDLLAIIRRKPQVVIVDELAHTNVPNMPHKKRFQDVLYLIERGISVWSAVNIQHIESLNDFVYNVTKVKVNELVPDPIIHRAKEIQLVDVTPEVLRKRLKEGKIYREAKIEQSLQNFFKLSNLHALRELCLREVAAEIDQQLLHSHEIGITGICERILVCIQYSETAEKLIRRGWRMANRLKAELLLLHVVSNEQLTEEQKKRIEDWGKFAATFQAKLIVEQANGRKPARVIVDVATKNHITQVLLGQSARTRWEEIRKGSIVTMIMRQTENIDIHIVSDGKRR